MILITGMSGFIGEHLARHLLADGHAVEGTCQRAGVDIPGATMHAASIDDIAPLIAARRPTAVVHCASATAVGWCEEHPAYAARAIVTLTERVACAARAAGAPMIYISTDLVFGGDEAPYSEDAETKPLNLYGSLKNDAEGAARALNPGTIVLRPALVYGPPATRGRSFLSWMVETLHAGKTLDLYRDEWRTPVFVGDVCSAVAALLSAPEEELAGRTFHAGGPRRLSRLDMGLAVCRAWGFDPALIRAADQPHHAGAPARPADVSLDCTNTTALGWRQISFEQGLMECRKNWI